jgi:hypothetical protein
MDFKKKVFILILMCGIILIGCTQESIEQELPVAEDVVEEPVAQIVVEPVVEEVIVEDTSCTTKTDCEWNEDCIENECSTISKIYDIDGVCTSKCNFNQVHITTSDGDEFELARGKGDYTLAGGIEWQLMSSADYCIKDDPTPVAIKLKKKNYGEVIQEQVIILDVGKTSEIISHPIMTNAAFTLRVDSINEECS